MYNSFLQVSKDLLYRCKELNLTEIVLYSILYNDYLHYKGDDGFSYVPKVKHLADLCHCSERTIQTALTHLEKLGLIQRYNRTGQTSVITVRLYDESILMTEDEQVERKALDVAKTEASKKRFTESNERRLAEQPEEAPEAPQDSVEPQPIRLQPEPEKTPQKAIESVSGDVKEIIVYQAADIFGALGKAGYKNQSFDIGNKIMAELKESNIATYDNFVFKKAV